MNKSGSEMTNTEGWQPVDKTIRPSIDSYLLRVYKEKRLAWIVGIGLLMIVTFFVKLWDLKTLEIALNPKNILQGVWLFEAAIFAMATLWFLVFVRRHYKSLMNKDLKYRVGEVTNKEHVTKFFRSRSYLTIALSKEKPWRKGVGLVLFNDLDKKDQLLQVFLGDNLKVYELIPMKYIESKASKIDE